MELVEGRYSFDQSLLAESHILGKPAQYTENLLALGTQRSGESNKPKSPELPTSCSAPATFPARPG